MYFIADNRFFNYINEYLLGVLIDHTGYREGFLVYDTDEVYEGGYSNVCNYTIRKNESWVQDSELIVARLSVNP